LGGGHRQAHRQQVKLVSLLDTPRISNKTKKLKGGGGNRQQGDLIKKVKLTL
jgi:hypothetical protein